MDVRPDGETDITRRFGRRILGSIPGRGTTLEIKEASVVLCRPEAGMVQW